MQCTMLHSPDRWGRRPPMYQWSMRSYRGKEHWTSPSKYWCWYHQQSFPNISEWHLVGPSKVNLMLYWYRTYRYWMKFRPLYSVPTRLWCILLVHRPTHHDRIGHSACIRKEKTVTVRLFTLNDQSRCIQTRIVRTSVTDSHRSVLCWEAGWSAFLEGVVVLKLLTGDCKGAIGSLINWFTNTTDAPRLLFPFEAIISRFFNTRKRILKFSQYGSLRMTACEKTSGFLLLRSRKWPCSNRGARTCWTEIRT